MPGRRLGRCRGRRLPDLRRSALGLGGAAGIGDDCRIAGIDGSTISSTADGRAGCLRRFELSLLDRGARVLCVGARRAQHERCNQLEWDDRSR